MKAKRNDLTPIFAGLATGLATGLLGGGGGMIAVPFLTRFLGKPTRVAHATAILVILPVTALGAILYSAFGSFPLSVGIPTGIGVTLGGALGALLLGALPPLATRRIFALAMLAAGLRMLF